jgi:serine/threonine protein kinase
MEKKEILKHSNSKLHVQHAVLEKQIMAGMRHRNVVQVPEMAFLCVRLDLSPSDFRRMCCWLWFWNGHRLLEKLQYHLILFCSYATRFKLIPSSTWFSTCARAAHCAISCTFPLRVCIYLICRYDYYLRQPNGRLDEVQARFIIAECVLALEYIHRFSFVFFVYFFRVLTPWYSKGYVHRDIKPENVLLTSDGHCKMVCLYVPSLAFCVHRVWDWIHDFEVFYGLRRPTLGFQLPTLIVSWLKLVRGFCRLI